MGDFKLFFYGMLATVVVWIASVVVVLGLIALAFGGVESIGAWRHKTTTETARKAYFDCDGYIDNKRGAGTIEASSASKELLEQIHIILLNFGIVSCFLPEKVSRQ